MLRLILSLCFVNCRPHPVLGCNQHLNGGEAVGEQYRIQYSIVYSIVQYIQYIVWRPGNLQTPLVVVVQLGGLLVVGITAHRIQSDGWLQLESSSAVSSFSCLYFEQRVKEHLCDLLIRFVVGIWSDTNSTLDNRIKVQGNILNIILNLDQKEFNRNDCSVLQARTLNAIRNNG